MKIQIKTVGYINIISRNRIETKEGNVLTFANVKELNEHKHSKESRKNKLFGQAFAQVAILEATINKVKEAVKNAKKHLLNSIEHFTLNMQVLKAYRALNVYKFSLPKYLKAILF